MTSHERHETVAEVVFPKMYVHIFWITLTATTPLVTPTEASRPCLDKLEDCSSHGDVDTLCTKYKGWSIVNCEAYCGFCKRPSTTTAPKPCVDKVENCGSYGHVNTLCTRYRSWASVNCEAYCGFCIGRSTTTAARPCLNKADNCASYGSVETLCTRYKSWASENCEAYCGFCIGQSTTVPTTLPTSTPPRPCVNKINNCASYGPASSLCLLYKSWASERCEAYCGFCVPPSTTTVATTPTTSTSPRPCVNKVDCASYGEVNTLCTEYRGWASDNCEAYCGFCVAPSTLPTKRSRPCVDLKDNCDAYPDDMCTNHLYKGFARTNCEAFCGFCIGPSTTTEFTPPKRTAVPLPPRPAGDCEDKFKYHFSGKHSACFARSSKHKGITGVSDKNKKLIVSLHNKVRSEVSDAKFMLKMRWDDEVAMVAQRWAEVCKFAHDSDRSIPGRFYVGQNIAYYSVRSTNWPFIIKLWADEKQYYTHGDKWNETFGHYTQMVTAGTYLIGCGEAICEGIGHYYVCNYAPGGMSRYPYPKGILGTACPTFIDNNNLCDCKQQFCYNGGDLDPETCKCKCSNFGVNNYKPEDNCKLFCKSAEKPPHCTEPDFLDTCGKYGSTPLQCPFMCNVCPWGGEDYSRGVVAMDEAKVDNGADFNNPSLTRTPFASAALVFLRTLRTL